MKILFLSRWFPFPPDNGSRIRLFNLLQAIGVEHEVDLISFTEHVVDEGRLKEMGRIVNVLDTVIYQPFFPTRINSLVGFFSTTPRSLINTYNLEMAAAIQIALSNNSYDLVIASELDMIPYTQNLPIRYKLLEELEVTSILWNIQKEKNLGRRFRNRLTWLKLSNYVRRMVKNFNGCTVVSQLELNTLKKNSPNYRNFRIIPNGVDSNYFRPDEKCLIEPDSMIYAGALTYHANYEAVEFFLRDIFPLIKTVKPNAKLYITGNNDAVNTNQLPNLENVIFTGYVQDIRTLYSRCCLSIVPLQSGGGTRLKILEALAMGTPVVSTPKGAEGLELINGEEIIIAETPRDFADSVIQLLGNHVKREQLSRAGRVKVESIYDWKMIGSSLSSFITELTVPK